MNKSQKGLANIILVVIIVVLVGATGYFALVRKSALVANPEAPVNQTPSSTISAITTSSNDGYEESLTYKWGTLKFNYPSNWEVRKDQEAGLEIALSGAIQSNDYIGVAGRQIGCDEVGMTRCINVGNGLDIFPVYTSSDNQEVLKTFDLIVKSAKDFGASTYFDIVAIRKAVSGFLLAKQNRNFNEAKPYLTPEFAKTIDSTVFVGASNPHTGRFEFKEGVVFSALAKAYQVKARVYQEYTGEGDIGYNDDIFDVEQIGDKYLIGNIEYGQYIELNGAPVVLNVVGDYSRVGQALTGKSLYVTGANFLNKNIVVLTPTDISLLPSYDIQAYNLPSTNQGTGISVMLSPDTFSYGTCRTAGGFCQGQLSAIPAGVYYLEVIKGNNCTEKCTSNKFPVTIDNQ